MDLSPEGPRDSEGVTQTWLYHTHKQTGRAAGHWKDEGSPWPEVFRKERRWARKEPGPTGPGKALLKSPALGSHDIVPFGL